MSYWKVGDLLEVVTTHNIEKGSMEGDYPDVFFDPPLETATVVEKGAVVIAMDPDPPSGARALVRVLYDDGVWVFNSNYVVPADPSTT